jgi:hypothetical protein
MHAAASPSRSAPLVAALTFLAALASATRAGAQDRPSEDDMFGSAPPAAEPAKPTAEPGSDAGLPAAAPSAGEASPVAPPTAAAGPAPDARDDAVLGGSSQPMFTSEPAPSDPLTIGGQIYLRGAVTLQQGRALKDASASAPSLVDVFLDARPNERVRGFVLGRMSYDPLLPPSSGGVALAPPSSTSGTTGSASLSSLVVSQTSAPHVALDQLWLRFDIAHELFVTAGRQHVRWGAAHVWMPADFLHLRHRNPLDIFDARVGTSMVKVHLPIESQGWNFYAYGITENQYGTPSLSAMAGAARAEFVLGANELGLGVFGRPHTHAKFAADLTMGVGDFDLYGELAVVNASDGDRVRHDADATLPVPGMPPSWQSPSEAGQALVQQTVDAVYPVYRDHGYRPQVAGGLSYARKYNDNDLLTINLEYFYNGLGYTNDSAYPGLVFPHSETLKNPATFFYLGAHYAALTFSLPAPYKLDLHTFTLTTLANLSDQSFITRFDYAYTLLTHLRLEAYAALHYGRPTGEFRFALSTDQFSSTLGKLHIPPSLLDLGVALRMSI